MRWKELRRRWYRWRRKRQCAHPERLRRRARHFAPAGPYRPRHLRGMEEEYKF